MVWPAYATEALVSNDGAFYPMRTSTITLSDSFDWVLEDAGDGVYSTTVYLRFIGPGIETARTYFDTIVLDRSPATTTTTTTTTVPVDNVAISTANTRGVRSMSVRTLSSQVARSSQRVFTQVLPSSRGVCRVVGHQVLAVRNGQCQVKVTVRTTNGRTVSRVLTFATKR